MEKRKLNDKLQEVYNEVDLTTTCERSLCCCKTACPQMNYSEFLNIIVPLWEDSTINQKIEYICKSIDYFFKFEFEKWGMDSLIKPCMLLDEENKACGCYDRRPLSCKLYGLWPSKMYNERAEKFAKIYETKYGVKSKDMPLHAQCPLVKRSNPGKELTEDLINNMFKKIEQIDRMVENFSDEDIEKKMHIRTFHDWLLFKVFGEEWLADLTEFMANASKEIIEAQMDAIKEVVKKEFKNNMPDIS